MYNETENSVRLLSRLWQTIFPDPRRIPNQLHAETNRCCVCVCFQWSGNSLFTTTKAIDCRFERELLVSLSLIGSLQIENESTRHMGALRRCQHRKFHRDAVVVFCAQRQTQNPF